MKTEIRRLERKEDARGWVIEPLGPDQLPQQRNVHFAVTYPGLIRGNHRHQRGTEILIVIGPALVRIREDEHSIDFEIPEGEVWQFKIPPGVAHAVKNIGQSPQWLIGFNTERHDPAQPDVVHDPLLAE